MTPVLSFFKKPPANAQTAAVLVFAGKTLSPGAAAIDKQAGGFLSEVLKNQTAFTGKTGQALSLFLSQENGFRRVAIIGAGEKEKLTGAALESLGGRLCALLKTMGAGEVSVFATTAEEAAGIAAGIMLRSYDFSTYKTTKKKGEDKPLPLKTVSMIVPDDKAAAKAYARIAPGVQGALFARDLTNEPPNILYPETYAIRIRDSLKPLGVDVEIMDEKKLEKLGFGALVAVGQGSARPPRLVVMRWNGAGGKNGKKKAQAPIAFVGKGMTYDSGGLSIKIPYTAMYDMKMDMAGSAAVVGAMMALSLRGAKVDAVGVVGLAENMISERAYRPADILTSLSGKTVDILNTDAEGRLVLADALTYVQKTYKPRLIVNLATLTGSILNALGPEYAGAYVNDDSLWSQLDSAGKQASEKLWRMPLDEAYRKEMESDVADLKNAGADGRWAGSCSLAAGFLEHFIENGTPWAHLDIAGTAWMKSDRATVPKGATGFGVRLLDRFVSDHYES